MVDVVPEQTCHSENVGFDLEHPENMEFEGIAGSTGGVDSTRSLSRNEVNPRDHSGLRLAISNGGISQNYDSVDTSDCLLSDGCQYVTLSGPLLYQNYTVPYMYIPGIGMIGPSPPQRCDQVARIGSAALHATATGVGNLKGTTSKLLSGLKFAAPTIGVYTEAGASLLGVGEVAAAGLGATVSGAAEAVGGLAAVYAVGSGIVDFYKQLTDQSIGCTVANR